MQASVYQPAIEWTIGKPLIPGWNHQAGLLRRAFLGGIVGSDLCAIDAAIMILVGFLKEGVAHANFPSVGFGFFKCDHAIVVRVGPGKHLVSLGVARYHPFRLGQLAVFVCIASVKDFGHQHVADFVAAQASVVISIGLVETIWLSGLSGRSSLTACEQAKKSAGGKAVMELNPEFHVFWFIDFGWISTCSRIDARAECFQKIRLPGAL
jgi:hypothetical protein